MTVSVHFWSWFKDLAGSSESRFELPAGTTVGELLAAVHARFPKLAAVRNSTLIAVGVEYQDPAYVLRAGEEVSLFPPVQGG